MTAVRGHSPVGGPAVESAIGIAANFLARYGLVIVIGWIGALKFTSYEAQGIQPLVANSPLMSWLYDIFSVTAFSTLLGLFEIVTAALLAVKPFAARLSLVGSVMAVGLFTGTISFLFTTPGTGEASAGGFPVLSSTGQFLIKDVALLGLSVWTFADGLRASQARLQLGRRLRVDGHQSNRPAGTPAS